MKKLKKYSIVLTALLTAFSCSEYLDYDEDKKWHDDQVWDSFSNITRAVSAVYSKLPGGHMEVDGAFLDASTDDAEHLDQWGDISRFNDGTVTKFDSPYANWTTNYDGINLANEAICRLEKVTLPYDQVDMVERKSNLESIERYKGEVRFLKAYFYFELMRRYGTVPIVESWEDDYMPTDGTRQSIDTIVKYIDEVATDAENYLPDLKTLTGDIYKNNLGRIFKGAAYALKCRTYLYAASPLFAPSQTKAKEYYKKAAENANLLFDEGYSLVSNYADLFEPNSSVMQNNKEVILDIRNAASNTLEQNNFPVGSYDGAGLTNPTQDLVDAYEMKDGTVFDWNNPTHKANPYKDRDSRFYATILYNGCVMKGRNGVPVETFVGGVDYSDNIKDGTRTGYYLKKYIDTDIDLTAVSPTTVRHYYPLFRYAEILLNFAEAMNELYGPEDNPDGYTMNALKAINAVRLRAGQPELSSGISQPELREMIRRERRIEFAFEGHRHWDVRRWKIGVQKFAAPIHGIEITRLGTSEPYTYDYKKIEVEDRVFHNYMHLYPIPDEAEMGADKIPQNEGW